MSLKNAFPTVFIVLLYIVVNGHEPVTQPDDHKPHWDYTGNNGNFDPLHWDDVSKYCNNKIYMQSPINIDTERLVRTPKGLECDPLHQLDIHFVNGCDGTIDGLAKNNGHSLVITPVQYFPQKQGFVKLNQENNVVMELSNFWNYNFHIAANQYYCFDSFHFHWGRVNNGKGSEHTINGKQYPLEAHFVHYSCDYNNIGEALSQWRLGGNVGVGADKKDIFVLGVVGVFFRIGAENPSLGRIFDRYQKLKTLNAEELIRDINLEELLPQNKAYYTYEGSLTTPPCFPVVKWHIMKETMEVSQGQMANLQQLMDSNGRPEGDNFRAVETNPNPVYDCDE